MLFSIVEKNIFFPQRKPRSRVIVSQNDKLICMFFNRPLIANLQTGALWDMVLKKMASTDFPLSTYDLFMRC